MDARFYNGGPDDGVPLRRHTCDCHECRACLCRDQFLPAPPVVTTVVTVTGTDTDLLLQQLKEALDAVNAHR